MAILFIAFYFVNFFEVLLDSFITDAVKKLSTSLTGIPSISYGRLSDNFKKLTVKKQQVYIQF